MRQYLDLLQHILDKGVVKSNRTGIDTKSIFGYQMRIDLSEGFPLLTTKKININNIIVELCWFLMGDTNIRFLVKNDCNIWSDWAYECYLKKVLYHKKYLIKAPGHEHPLTRYSDTWKAEKEEFIQKIKYDKEFAKEWGDLGPFIYGKSWCRWEDKDGNTINQIADAIDLIKTEPNSRRIIVNAWNVAEIHHLVKDPDIAPPPCHTLFQLMVINGKLSCQLYQRSADVFLGVPYNIASYALLTMMIAQVCDLEVGEFIHTFGDVHIYANHMDQVKLQLSREPKQLPTMKLNPEIKDISKFGIDDFTLENYNPDGFIKAQVAV